MSKESHLARNVGMPFEGARARQSGYARRRFVSPEIPKDYVKGQVPPREVTQEELPLVYTVEPAPHERYLLFDPDDLL